MVLASIQAMLMCSLERDNRGKDHAQAETVRRAVQQAKIAPFYAAEFSSENVQLSLSIGWLVGLAMRMDGKKWKRKC